MNKDVTRNEALLIVSKWQREKTRIRVSLTSEKPWYFLKATCTVTECTTGLTLDGDNYFHTLLSVGESGWHIANAGELPVLAREQLGCAEAVNELLIVGFRWPDGAMLLMYEEGGLRAGVSSGLVEAPSTVAQELEAA